MSHNKYRTETDCLNCGAEVTGKFCSACGQENIEVHDSFFHLVGHFVADYFHYDSKFLRSMKLLFFRPGFLTKQYWDGRRVAYIHPLRLYFFIVVIGVLMGGIFFEHYKNDIKDRIIKTTVTDNDTTKVQIGEDSGASISWTRDIPDSTVTDVDALKAQKGGDAREQISIGLDRFIGHLKFILFGLLPLYALIFKILYIRRKSFYVDHLIYAMHLQSFAFLSELVFTLLAFLIPILDSPLKWSSYGLIMVYTTISLRYLYQQSWWKTILKSLIATVLILLGLGLVFVAYMVIALLNVS
ncbi:DUF3667 domain-containing protein [Pseudochryseolinea flava]|uniref:DUF3667 domain-containing protein n=1 Tax=Pseudochryseolinea flava TaxID=2059302 RepID=A0A364Y6S7_9BACT|nr:DUF3667 domain-containing protein [Pseudochryseolinea flava]RAW02761.1 hypothetical protein DQQ10_01235 [Pseudochryseolinea flava]